MKLHTNLNNTSALKVLIAAGCTGKTLDVIIEEVANVSFQPQRLPFLEIYAGEFLFPTNEICPEQYLFSTNAASYYLYTPPKDVDDDVHRWLDWEATNLQPGLVNCVDSKSEVTEPLPTLLSVLDAHLKSNKFIIKDELSVADAVIWSTLYPVLADKKLNKSVTFNRNSLSEWFNKLKEIPAFKNAVSKLNPAGGVASLQSISSASWYPANISHPLKQSIPSATLVQNEAPTKDTPVTEEELKSAEDAWTKGTKTRPLPKPAVVPVLPKDGEKNVLITSALPYVNNVPHLGNLIGCVLSADAFARYSRLRNWNTLYISGTDEYGTATETKALEEGLTPREICNKYYEIHKSIYTWFNIEFDMFGRTTHPEQTQIVQEMFLICHKNGYTTTSSVEQLLCEKCDRYLADRFVEGTCPDCAYEDARGDQCDGCGHLINATELINPRCKICRNTPVIKESQQLFLDLPKLQPRLDEWSAKTSAGWSNNAMVITKAWLKKGLNPRCITRDLKWGIPVPLAGFEQKVFYVWFDAPIGYMSMTKSYTENWKQWWQPSSKAKVTCYQFMAKDNVPFHSIMFPATLLASGKDYVLVDHLMATEYLNYEDGKFSKSRGVGVFGNDAQDTGIPSDIFRFYLLYVRPENQDSSFSWTDLVTKNNSELLNNLGNFINRALVFAEKNFNSKIPKMELSKDDFTLLALITREVQGYIQALDKSKLRDGIRYILNISRHGNFYMQSTQPWVLLKQTDHDKLRAGTIIGLCCNIACLLGILLKPYMPSTSKTIGEQLQAPEDVWILTENVYQLLKPGHTIGKPSPLFAKIELSTAEELKKRFSGRQKSSSPAASVATNLVTMPVPDSVDKLEAAIAKQAELVRTLKASSEKSVWQPQVAVLLDMKKQLAAMKGESEQPKKPAKAPKQKGKAVNAS